MEALNKWGFLSLGKISWKCSPVVPRSDYRKKALVFACECTSLPPPLLYNRRKVLSNTAARSHFVPGFYQLLLHDNVPPPKKKTNPRCPKTSVTHVEDIDTIAPRPVPSPQTPAPTCLLSGINRVTRCLRALASHCVCGPGASQAALSLTRLRFHC